MAVDNDILKEFISESKGLISNCLELLEGIEGSFSQVAGLKQYANEVDRIMGGAKNLALLVGKDHPLHLISDYSALCKAVGYQASQIQDNEEFFNICVALLLDATETLDVLIDNVGQPIGYVKNQISDTFIERLRWVSKKFDSSYSQTVVREVQADKMDQSEIDRLLKKLGI